MKILASEGILMLFVKSFMNKLNSQINLFELRFQKNAVIDLFKNMFKSCSNYVQSSSLVHIFYSSFVVKLITEHPPHHTSITAFPQAHSSRSHAVNNLAVSLFLATLSTSTITTIFYLLGKIKTTIYLTIFPPTIYNTNYLLPSTNLKEVRI